MAETRILEVSITDRAKRLALILQAIDDCERDFAETKTEYRDKLQRLNNQAWALRCEILNGQEVLPMTPPEAA